jgi:hypothetical protein
MQSGKRLTLKDYFAKQLVHTRIIKIQILNCYIVNCQVQLFLDNMVLANQNAKLTGPDQGLPRLSPRPHTEALGTRLQSAILTRSANQCKIFARSEIRTIFSVKSDDSKTYSPPPPLNDALSSPARTKRLLRRLMGRWFNSLLRNSAIRPKREISRISTSPVSYRSETYW